MHFYKYQVSSIKKSSSELNYQKRKEKSTGAQNLIKKSIIHSNPSQYIKQMTLHRFDERINWAFPTQERLLTLLNKLTSL